MFLVFRSLSCDVFALLINFASFFLLCCYTYMYKYTVAIFVLLASCSQICI